MLSCGDDKSSSPEIPVVNATILYPNDGQIVFDTVNIIFKFVDSQYVSNIAVYIDSVLWGEVEKAPWQAEWITNDQYRDSSEHSIHAQVYNTSGKRNYTDTITVTVNNDKISPAAITDLKIIDSSYSSLIVSWTTTGDDSLTGNVNRYDLRYLSEPLTNDNWDSGIACTTGFQIIPPGLEDTIIIQDLPSNGEFYVALKAIDEVGNETSVSNCIRGATIILPAITDASVEYVTDTSVILSWTVPGSVTGMGRPHAYDIRYHVLPITADSWENTTKFKSDINPQTAGMTETIEVTGLQKNTPYYFAISCWDIAGIEGGISNLVYFLKGAMFDSPYTCLFSKSAYGICTADLNGDGYNDLATTDKNSPHISVIINNRDKTFTRTMNFYTGESPDGIIAVDVDLDEDIDLVVANYGIAPPSPYDYIQVMPNNGAAVFQRYSYNVEESPRSIFASDFNNDGSPDLAVTSEWKDSVLILLNMGNGFFSQYEAYPVGPFPNGIAGADFNDDGYTDLVVANWYNGGVSVLLNDGAAHFWNHHSYVAGERPISVCTGDYDLDGDFDFAVANEYSDDFNIFLNNGNGAFSKSATHQVYDDPTSIINHDFTNDGILDIAVSNYTGNKIYIYVGIGNGSFEEVEIIESPGNPRSICGADFDLDGDIDIAATNYNDQGIVVHYNNLIH